MPFGMVGRLGQRMRQVVGIGNCPTGRGNFGGGCGAPHCKQCGLCGVVFRKCAKRSSCHFGVVKRVGPGIGVLDADPGPPRRKGGFGFFLVHWF